MSSTIKDVAKKAGVSIATVSKFLNGGNVLAKNRATIEEAIQTLHYRVNAVARGMKTRRSMTVGVLIPSLADYFGVSILSTIDQDLFQYGYSTIICDYCGNDANSAKVKLEFLMNKQVDGIIMQPVGVRQSDLERIERQGTPIVFVDDQVGDRQHDCVLINNAEITHRMTKHLTDHGHERIGLISGSESVFTTVERVAGYRQALDDARIPFREEYLHRINVTETSGYEGMKHLMALSTPPTAVCTTGYDLTIGALTYMNEKGIRIPEDISFVGFENQTIARMYRPKLTIGVQPIRDIGLAASKMLMERMAGEYEGSGRSVLMEASIDFGASVRDIRR
jgi:LacI family transcriptional regulator